MEEALESFSRVDRGRVLARLIAVMGDFDLAEDALQDALVAAAVTWPINGVPDNPAGWLVTTARRKAIDRLRGAVASERRQRAWGELAIAWGTGEDAQPIVDDRLRLIFTCCHPALGLEAQVALTLRSLCGLSTEEVAKAFLISPTALAQRIVRAKRKIRQAGIAYRVPPPSELPQRLAAVLVVIYLVFNAGYLCPVGTELVNVDLCDEALRLIAVVIDLLPGEPEPLALAAMMYFQDSRRDARVDVDGIPVTLEHQDRSRWDLAKVGMGLSLLDRARRTGRPGPYVLKASIGAVHVKAPRSECTDWASIVRLYDSLLEWEPTAVVRLNRSVAVAMAESPAAGLALVEDPDLASQLANYYLYEATRADLLRRSGRWDDAAVAYRRAREQTGNEAERRYIDQRLSTLATGVDRAAREPGGVSSTLSGGTVEAD